MYCPNCASQEFDVLVDGSGRCRYCGTIIPGVAKPAPNVFEQQLNNIGTNFQTGKRDKIVALLLTFFLGGFGAQYFYYGEYVKGVLCLIFCWTFIPAIWAFIHFIILLTMSDAQFNAKYNAPNR
ncbi:MAG: NINE protein [Muribaculaceae bacterium]|nr:NINE protein [Muribaculaceae bacterium]